jgi:hypothetical protein
MNQRNNQTDLGLIERLEEELHSDAEKRKEKQTGEASSVCGHSSLATSKLALTRSRAHALKKTRTLSLTHTNTQTHKHIDTHKNTTKGMQVQ